MEFFDSCVSSMEGVKQEKHFKNGHVFNEIDHEMYLNDDLFETKVTMKPKEDLKIIEEDSHTSQSNVIMPEEAPTEAVQSEDNSA